jgi:hypothetical protein
VPNYLKYGFPVLAILGIAGWGGYLVGRDVTVARSHNSSTVRSNVKSHASSPSLSATAPALPTKEVAIRAVDEAIAQIDGEQRRLPASLSPKPKSYSQTTPELQRQWEVMNEECRGGQHNPDDAICTDRDNIGVALEARGICWAYSDWRVYPTDFRWHPCSQARPVGWRPD